MIVFVVFWGVVSKGWMGGVVVLAWSVLWKWERGKLVVSCDSSVRIC